MKKAKIEEKENFYKSENNSIKIALNYILKILLILFYALLLLSTKAYNNKTRKDSFKTNQNPGKTSNFKLLFQKRNLIKNENQTLNLLIPSKKCKNLSPKTVYLFSEFRNKSSFNDNNNNIERIILNKTNKEFFVTFSSFGREKNLSYYDVLKYNNFINTHSPFKTENNIIFGTLIFKYHRPLLRIGNKYIIHNKFQKIYDSLLELHGKNLLYKYYLEMKTIFNEEYNFMPKTFIYPEDKDLINQKFDNYKLNFDDLWLVKPSHLSRGKGIQFFESVNQIEYKDYIITKFISNPDLINNKKYDLRLYVLLSGIKPLRIYLNKEGLVRRASENYNITEQSIKNKCIFLTNTAINKNNTKYIFPKNINDMEASVWNFNSYKNYLKGKKVNYNLLFDKIKDIIIKSVISFYNKIINGNNIKDTSDKNRFNLLGFDILIDDKYEPILLEINTMPDMEIYNKVDKIFKSNLIADILNVIGISLYSHKNKYYDKIYNYTNTIEELVDNAFCELTRPRGDLELIFPLEENINKYKKFFINNIEENKRLWEKLF